MRIVQTFWTGNHNPLEYGFGWPHAEYNLMSWALSCLSLREHYDEVVLYTDTPGKRILIDELHLPYTDVQVVFDDFPCLPQHWALAKIKTYSLQTKPFLHVDGDIYVPHPLPEDILAAPLIAQNREIGTVYYRRMMDRILSHPEIKLPDYIEQGLREESIASYNMGFFGGSDLSFIHDFCKEVSRFMEENRMNDAQCPHSHVNCNVFFEQVTFAVMADKKGKDVASVLGHNMRDNGYTRNEFCDLLHYSEHLFHHLLGGHKRNKTVYHLLTHTFLRLYPTYYNNVLSLFPERHLRYGYNNRNIGVARLDYYLMYDKFISDSIERSKNIPVNSLLFQGYDRENYIFRKRCNQDKDGSLIIQANPHAKIFSLPNDTEIIELFKQISKYRKESSLKCVAFVPVLRGKGYKEVPLSEDDILIYQMTNKKQFTVNELINKSAAIIFSTKDLSKAKRLYSQQLVHNLILKRILCCKSIKS